MEEIKVIYTGDGGFDSDKVYADRFLEVGKEYTLEYVDVGSWCSSVYLKEFKDKPFNSVMFEGKDGYDFMEDYLYEYDEYYYGDEE